MLLNRERDFMTAILSRPRRGGLPRQIPKIPPPAASGGPKTRKLPKTEMVVFWHIAEIRINLDRGFVWELEAHLLFFHNSGSGRKFQGRFFWNVSPRRRRRQEAYLLGPIWAHIGPIWAQIGPKWSQMGPKLFLNPFGPILGPYGPILGP